MSYFAEAVAKALAEGPTDTDLVASWLYYQGPRPEEVIAALPAALLDAQPSVIQNAQEGINKLWSRFGLEITVDLQAEVTRLNHSADACDAEDTQPAKRSRMA
jgi:hypothetical protein